MPEHSTYVLKMNILEVNKSEAFAEQVSLHQSSLRAHIRSLGVKSEKVDDYAQDAFLVAYKKFHKFDFEKSSFKVWLKGIIHYLVLNDKRKFARRCRLQDKLINASIIEQSKNTDLYNEDELYTLQQCLSKLEGPSREIIKKRYEENKSSKELAIIFNRNPSTVRQNLMRIRAILKRCMIKTLENQR